MNSLYLIGNGFDLFHGIQSSYLNFAKYLEKNDSEAHYYLERYISYDYPNDESLWNKFEENLGNLDIEAIFADEHPNILDEDFRNRDIYIFEDQLENICDMLTDRLKNEFEDWILSLDVPEYGELDIPETATYLTFNYTTTLEDIYNIPENCITYIHNKAGSGDIILGHSIKLDSEFDIDEGSPLDTAKTNISQYFERSFKPTQAIIDENKVFFQSLKNIEQINVLGHSLSEVDLPYFKEIIKNIDLGKVEWRVSYYGIAEKEHHKKVLLSLGIPNNRSNWQKWTPLSHYHHSYLLVK